MKAGVRIAAAAVAVVALVIAATVASYCSYGFDFTDESLYVRWISNPWAYPVSISQFGLIYHPIYRLVGGDLVTLRIVNVIITAALTSVVAAHVVRHAWSELPASAAAGFGVALSVASLVALRNWVPTPSYNWLTFQALLLVALGSLSVIEARRSIVAGVIIGIGGWLAFMAKPTSAAMAGVLVVLCLWLARRFDLRAIAAAAATALVLLLASAYALDGSLGQFIARMQLATADAQLLSDRYEAGGLLRIDAVEFSRREWWVFGGLAALGTVLTVAGSLTTLAVLPAVAITLAATLLLLSGKVGWPWAGTAHTVFWIAAVPCGAIVGTAIAGRGWRLSRASYATIVLLICLPIAAAFGTGSNLPRAASRAGVFWVLAGVTIVGLLRRTPHWGAIAGLCAATQLVTVVLVRAGIESPYRQFVPLREMPSEIILSTGFRPIRVQAPTAVYVNDLRSVAGAHGFAAGIPVIDLTGHFPGASLVLGGTAAGAAWLVGGYPRSADAAILALQRVPCEDLARSWLLTEPAERRRSLPAGVLPALGLDLERDFERVATIPSPPSDYPRPVPQGFFKPSATSQAAASCRQLRAASPR